MADSESKVALSLVVDTVEDWKERIKRRISMNETTIREHPDMWAKELANTRVNAYKTALADFEEIVG